MHVRAAGNAFVSWFGWVDDFERVDLRAVGVGRMLIRRDLTRSRIVVDELTLWPTVTVTVEGLTTPLAMVIVAPTGPGLPVIGEGLFDPP
jgi:hypothetical protein